MSDQLLFHHSTGQDREFLITDTKVSHLNKLGLALSESLPSDRGEMLLLNNFEDIVAKTSNPSTRRVTAKIELSFDASDAHLQTLPLALDQQDVVTPVAFALQYRRTWLALSLCSLIVGVLCGLSFGGLLLSVSIGTALVLFTSVLIFVLFKIGEAGDAGRGDSGEEAKMVRAISARRA